MVAGFTAYIVGFVLPRAGVYEFALDAMLGETSVYVGALMKALPVLLLSLDAWSAASSVDRVSPSANTFARYISFGLALGSIGDVCLDLGDAFFQLGLVSFLMGHVWYCAASVHDGAKQSVLAAIPFAAVVCGLLYVLIPEVEDALKVPVLVYAATIGVMGYLAVVRASSVSGASYAVGVVGALLFMVSDAILAVGRFKFKDALPYTKLAVMLTYYAAQYFSCWSATSLCYAASAAVGADKKEASVPAASPKKATPAISDKRTRTAEKEKEAETGPTTPGTPAPASGAGSAGARKRK